MIRLSIFNAWLELMDHEWKDAQTNQEFAPWVSTKEWDNREMRAWERLNPGEKFTPEKMDKWREIQHVTYPLLSEPEWLLREEEEKENKPTASSKNPEKTFDMWVKKITTERRNWWKDKVEKGDGSFPFSKLDDATFKKLESLWCEYSFKSGSALDFEIYVLKELWKETGPMDCSDEAFVRHLEFQRFSYKEFDSERRNQLQPKIEKRQAHLDRLNIKLGQKKGNAKNAISTLIYAYEKELNVIKKSLTDYPSQKILEEWKEAQGPELIQKYDDWKVLQNQKLLDRHAATRTTLSFDMWKSQQVFDPILPMSFVRLDDSSRQAYRTNCEHGYLTRENGPFPTTKESTCHNGEGWVIFVIGPKDELYCGSHLRNVFHHSSFLEDAAVMAGGEIKTDDKGKITEISAKSGHYQPTDIQNRQMLRWFKWRGVDLKQVWFTCFVKDGDNVGESKRMRADKYLHGFVKPELKA